MIEYLKSVSINVFSPTLGDGFISLAYLTDHSHNINIYSYYINLIVL